MVLAQQRRQTVQLSIVICLHNRAGVSSATEKGEGKEHEAVIFREQIEARFCTRDVFLTEGVATFLYHRWKPPGGLGATKMTFTFTTGNGGRLPKSSVVLQFPFRVHRSADLLQAAH